MIGDSNIAVFGLSKGYFDKNNDREAVNIVIVLVATAFPVIPLLADVILNLKKEKKNLVSDIKSAVDGGEEDEL